MKYVKAEWWYMARFGEAHFIPSRLWNRFLPPQLINWPQLKKSKECSPVSKKNTVYSDKKMYLDLMCRLDVKNWAVLILPKNCFIQPSNLSKFQLSRLTWSQVCIKRQQVPESSMIFLSHGRGLRSLNRCRKKDPNKSQRKNSNWMRIWFCKGCLRI